MKKNLFFLLFALFSFQYGYSQQELTRILFILDASNSMNKKWGQDSRIVTAKRILSQSIDSLRGSANLELALRVYGHQSPVTPTFQDCNDTKLEIPFGPNNEQRILDKIRTITAKGTTPIARSLEQAADDFPDKTTRNIIILITDGIEACDGDPCTIATKLKDKGVSIRPFVIGLGLDMSYLSHFDCYGEYRSAEDARTFKSVLKSVVDKALVNTTAQVNLNTINGSPTETDVTMFFYKAGTKELKYTFTHTLNERRLPDTLILNPSWKYDLVVKTLPPVEKKDISLIKNTHNTIPVDAPQGKLQFSFYQATRLDYVDARVMKKGENATLNVQKFNQEPQKYIVGEYDVEILTLPRRYQTVTVTQSTTTKISIDAPGIITLSGYYPMTGQIFEVMDTNDFEWVCDLNDQVKENKFNLQPGKYMIVYRQKDSKESEHTKTEYFDVYPNRLTTIKL